MTISDLPQPYTMPPRRTRLRLAVLGALIVVFAVGFFVLVLPSSDTFTLLDTMPSPDGLRVVDRVLRLQDDGDGATQTPFVLFELRHASQPAMKTWPFLRREMIFDGVNNDGVDPESVFDRWLDNADLLIAAPIYRRDADTLQPHKTGDVFITYEFYDENEPDTFRAGVIPKIDHEALDFRFQQTPGEDFCRLKAHTVSGETVSLILNWQGISLSVLEANPFSQLTSLKMVSSWLDSGKSGFGATYTDHVVSGLRGMNLTWKTHPGQDYSVDARHVLDELRAGQVAIKAGYWLEGKEIVFTTALPLSVGERSSFDACAHWA